MKSYSRFFRRFSLIALANCFLAMVLGADSIFEKFSEEQGLSSNIVRCIFQDSSGFLWIGTEDGLNRFDAHGFTTFKNDPRQPSSLSNNSITVIRQGTDGTLWIGTKNGLNSLAPGTGKCTRHFPAPAAANSPAANHITAMLIDRGGTLWVSTLGGGLIRLDGRTNRWRRFAGDFLFDYISALCEDEAGIIWAGTLSDGIIRIDPATGQWRNIHAEGSTENNITAILSDGEGRLWLGTKAGLRIFQKAGERWVRSGNALPLLPPPALLEINSLLLDKDKSIWIGTGIENEGSGLFQFNPETRIWRRWIHSANEPDSLSHNTVISIFQDRTGLIWIGTDGKGLCLYDPLMENWRHYRIAPEQRIIHLTTAICADSSGILWIGTNGAGLFAFDRDRESWRLHLPGQYVRSITEDSQGNIWVGTFSGGLFSLDRSRLRWRQLRSGTPEGQGLGSNNIKAIVPERPGILWIGTWDAGLCRFDVQNKEWIHFKANPGRGLSSNMVSCLLQDHAGMLWIGTRGGGLNRLDPKSGTWLIFQNAPDNPDSLSNDIVRCMAEDRSGNLWIGTNEGLNRLDRARQHWRHFSRADGLTADAIFGIIEDGRGYLWISTNRGLSRLDPAAGRIRNFDAHDGLRSVEFEPNSIARSRQDEIFLGWKNSFTAFSPDRIPERTPPPPVVITDFRIFNESARQLLLRPGGIRLPHGKNYVSFEFSALDFRNPGRHQYAYRMEGVNDDWILCGNQHAVNFLLPDGRFVFHLKAANSQGVWNEEGLTVAVTIVPPFWKRPWFFVLALLVLIAGAAGAYRVRIRRLESLKNELTRQVDERTKQLSLALVDLDEMNKDLQKQIAKRQIVEEALKQSNSKLQESNEKLKELDQLKTEFLNLVSHELRTPLTSVIGFTKIIRRRLAEHVFPRIPSSGDQRLAGTLEQVSQNMEIILAEGQRLTKLINDLLDIAKIEAGKLNWKKERLSLGALIQEALVSTSPLFEEKRLQLLTRIAGEAADVHGDRDRINQVIINLLSNAIKFTPPEGTITVTLGKIAGSVAGDGNGAGEWAVTISDTGPGITLENQRQLFEKFRQVVSPSGETIRGTGLGLHICKQIIEHHGGRIWVESEPGRGSTFSFCLPLPAPPAPAR